MKHAKRLAVGLLLLAIPVLAGGLLSFVDEDLIRLFFQGVFLLGICGAAYLIGALVLD